MTTLAELRSGTGSVSSVSFSADGCQILASGRGTLGSSTGAPLPGITEFATRLNDPAEIRAAAKRIESIAGQKGSVLVAGGGMTGIEKDSASADIFRACEIPPTRFVSNWM